MLVLSRKPNEWIDIEVPPSSETTRVRVMLVDAQASKARLGFEASPEVKIHRAEVAEAIAAGVPVHALASKPEKK